MQTTSALWKRLWAAGARLETVAVIDGTACETVTAPVIHRALTQEGLSVGNAVSATCALSVRAAGSIPRAATVAVRMRLTDGETCSEWLEAGTFYVSRRATDAVTGLTTLECYDAMLKANAEYPCDGQWPRPMTRVVQEIAEALGVAQDGRNAIQTGDDFQILLPEAGTTMREVLSGIASAHGGNWIITPRNRLRLVPLGASDGEAAVLAVLGGVSAGATQAVTGLRVTGVGEERLIGSADGLVVEIASPYVTEGSLSWLSQQLIGTECQPYALESAIYDPAAELGDAVVSKEDVASAIYSESVTLGAAFRGDIAAPEPEELSDEYPYLGTPDRLKRLRQTVATLEETKAGVADVAAAEARANAVTAALEQSLTQQEIFNRLTQNGRTQGIYLKDGRLYINGTYIDAGTLNANLLRAGTISDATGKNYWILDGNNSELVTKKGVIGNFTLEDGALSYGTLGQGFGASIGRYGIRYSMPLIGTDIAEMEITGQGMHFYVNSLIKTMLYMGQKNGLILRCYDENGSADFVVQVFDETSKQEIDVHYDFYVSRLARFYSNVEMWKDLKVTGALKVNGTKNRVADAGQYGRRLLYSYETPTPMFGDVGEGQIGADGRCFVWLDPVFAGTISAAQYQVFLQGYGEGECHVAERRGSCFIVEGTPALAFAWELKARQRDYDQRRLDAADPFEFPRGRDSGESAAQYIQTLKEGRIPA